MWEPGGQGLECVARSHQVHQLLQNQIDCARHHWLEQPWSKAPRGAHGVPLGPRAPSGLPQVLSCSEAWNCSSHTASLVERGCSLRLAGTRKLKTRCFLSEASTGLDSVWPWKAGLPLRKPCSPQHCHKNSGKVKPFQVCVSTVNRGESWPLASWRCSAPPPPCPSLPGLRDTSAAPSAQTVPLQSEALCPNSHSLPSSAEACPGL